MCVGSPAEQFRTQGHGFLLGLGQFGGNSDDVAIGLELSERAFHDALRPFVTECLQEVDTHVVARCEGGNQRICARGCETCDSFRIHCRGPLHHGIADGVDTTTASATCHLRVLARREIHVCFSVELDQLLQHDCAGRHVDAQCERLGGEDDLDQAFVKELFHNVPERRQHARVVRRKTTDEDAAPAQEAENLQVLLRNVSHTVIDNLFDALLLIPVGEFCARSTDLCERTFAARAGEDENNRGQHIHGAEHADNIATLRRAELALPLISPAVRAPTALVLFVLVALPGSSVPVAELGATARFQQVLIDLVRLRLEEWIEPVSHQHVLM